MSCPLCKREDAKLLSTIGDWPGVVECVRCGRFSVSEDFLTNTHGSSGFPLLCGLARERTELGDRLVITRDNYEDLIRLAPTTMTRKSRKLLLAIARKSVPPGTVVNLSNDHDYPLAYAASSQELGFLFNSLVARKLVVSATTTSHFGGVLTYEGWIEAERNTASQSDKAFVAMYFTPEMNTIFRDAIAPACESVGYKAVKVDDLEHVGKIDDRIIAEIKESRFIVADFTGHRGGVYFEAGYALGLGLPVIWTCRQDDLEKLHFDIRQYNCIVWSDAASLKDRLANRIRAAVGNRALRSGIASMGVLRSH